MSIDIEQVVKREIEKEKKALKELKERNDLDALSKQEVRIRSYDTYRHLQRQLELDLF